jgi:hypothetical protein
MGVDEPGDSLDGHLWRVLDISFPDSYRMPAQRRELIVDFSVTFDISKEFSNPPLLSRCLERLQ